jgi:hypothetical protein
MFLSVRCSDYFPRYFGNIASYLLFNEWGSPILLGVEYPFPTGTAWSFAKESDRDFSKLLEQGGFLSTVIPGRVPGLASLLCTPFLCKGVPCWTAPVAALSVAADVKHTPLVVAYKTEQGFFDSSNCSDSDFLSKKEHARL